MNEIIYKYLRELFEKLEGFSRYMDVPAVFDTKAPNDVDENWNDTQYPRSIFELNMQADPERKISGRLFVDVMCESEESSIQPETLATMVKEAVDGCFFSTPDLTISAQWESSDNFQNQDNKVNGITVTFAILAYPIQETESPDPVKAVNLWLKTLYQNAYVIGKDTLPDVWKATDENPALYCHISHLGESPRMKSTAAVTWIGANMNVNVIAPSEKVRNIISKSATQILINATRLMLDDGSPMLIDSVSDNLAADPLREGQIQIKATYGVLNTYTGTPLRNVFVTGINVEREVKNNG